MDMRSVHMLKKCEPNQQTRTLLRWWRERSIPTQHGYLECARLRPAAAPQKAFAVQTRHHGTANKKFSLSRSAHSENTTDSAPGAQLHHPLGYLRRFCSRRCTLYRRWMRRRPMDEGRSHGAQVLELDGGPDHPAQRTQHKRKITKSDHNVRARVIGEVYATHHRTSVRAGLTRSVRRRRLNELCVPNHGKTHENWCPKSRDTHK